MTDLFSLDNLPYGVAAKPGHAPHVVARIGDHAIDLAGLAATTGGEQWAEAFAQPTLNAFIDTGHDSWTAARRWLQEVLRDRTAEALPFLHSLSELTMLLPIQVADYVDFYASEQHATNVGRVFRPDGDALTPNWKHLPIGYHGRSGTIVVDGTDVVRPCGQRKDPADAAPTYGPSIRLDIEAEVGFVVGGATAMGDRVSIEQAGDHLFGVALFNDWSARDLQAWEYVPLGPFLGKSFASSLAAWVTPLEALEPAKITLPQQNPQPLPYLRGDLWGLDLAMEVELNGVVISRPPAAGLYWSPAQMLAHLTVNGASLRTGDLFASGTVSGSEPGSRGSLLELTWNGTEPIELPDGSTRAFLQDNDQVVLRATAPGSNGGRIGLGDVGGRISPARY
ncbi:fumarylacetoacetase [Calidifontibacter terrae]